MIIEELKLYTSNLIAQTAFYSKVLDLEIVNQSDSNVSFRIGRSVLTWVYRAWATPYHFAFNIPANKEEEALAWLKNRVDVLRDGLNEIQDFDFWNAKAVYFYDPDKNIVELIARKNLNNKSDLRFDSDQLLEISEIGLPTENIEAEFNILKNIIGVEIFDGGFERFCAIGDEHGLFICINKNVKDWFPTNDKAYSSDFDIIVSDKGSEYQIEYKNGELC